MAGVLVLAFNLRAAITSLPPLFPELSSSMHLSSAALAALAATPVPGFGVFSPVSLRRCRADTGKSVLLVALVLLAVGLLVRAALPGWLLFPAPCSPPPPSR